MNDELKTICFSFIILHSAFCLHHFPLGSGLSPRFDLSFGNSIDLPPDLRALVASRICLFFLSVRWPSFFCRVFSDMLALLSARSLKLRPLHAMRTHAPATLATLPACTRESDSTTLAPLMLHTTQQTARAH